MSLVESGCVDLSGVKIIVLDEADRLFDMGFVHQVKFVNICFRILFFIFIIFVLIRYELLC